jgi:16S rRNA (adenine1518-N6/adenine1519-N6)-dimethyltransferase
MEPTPAPLMLSKYGLAPSRERGQNFLVDANVARKVVDAVRAGPEDTVLEIGSGFGAITFSLVRAAGHVVAIEYDAGIVRAFREEYGETPGLTLVEGDALDFDMREAARASGASRLIVAGNIPYAVTSPLLRRVVENRDLVIRAVLMMQKEVAERIVARPGGAGSSALTAVMAFHALVTPLFTVKRTCFHPRPAVDSMVVEIDLERAPSRRADPVLYSEVVHAAFGSRRKMLRRTLAELVRRRGTSVEEMAGRTGIDMTRRGETLSVEEFEALALALSETSG